MACVLKMTPIVRSKMLVSKRTKPKDFRPRNCYANQNVRVSKKKYFVCGYSCWVAFQIAAFAFGLIIAIMGAIKILLEGKPYMTVLYVIIPIAQYVFQAFSLSFIMKMYKSKKEIDHFNCCRCCGFHLFWICHILVIVHLISIHILIKFFLFNK